MLKCNRLIILYRALINSDPAVSLLYRAIFLAYYATNLRNEKNNVLKYLLPSNELAHGAS